jgi:pimeloyl-ACP methyl ester carboxylesterase
MIKEIFLQSRNLFAFSSLILSLMLCVQVFLVAKDFGARPAYLFAILHPERVLGVVTIGVPFMPQRSTFHKHLPEGFYISRWRVNRSSGPHPFYLKFQI